MAIRTCAVRRPPCFTGATARCAATFQGAWTRTGDEYERNTDGYDVYAGRREDMLQVSGQYASPFEVEATLVQHLAVLEPALIGVADEHGLTGPKAFVVLKDRGQATAALAEALKQFARARLAPHESPRPIEFIDELPKTAAGKNSALPAAGGRAIWRGALIRPASRYDAARNPIDDR